MEAGGSGWRVGPSSGARDLLMFVYTLSLLVKVSRKPLSEPRDREVEKRANVEQ